VYTAAVEIFRPWRNNVAIKNTWLGGRRRGGSYVRVSCFSCHNANVTRKSLAIQDPRAILSDTPIHSESCQNLYFLLVLCPKLKKSRLRDHRAVFYTTWPIFTKTGSPRMSRQGTFSFPQSVITTWQTRKLVQRLYRYCRLQGVATQRTLVAGYRRFGTTRLATRAIRDGSAQRYGETTKQHRTTHDNMDCSATRQHR